MLQLDFRRNTLLWILGATFALGLGVDLVRVATHREVNFPLAVAEDDEARALKRTADSIMQARVAAAKAPININTATSMQLETLDGIGRVLAQHIVAYREQNGPFTSVDDLDAVSGIGRKRLAAIRDRCCVN
jgi:competence protein ComEA